MDRVSARKRANEWAYASRKLGRHRKNHTHQFMQHWERTYKHSFAIAYAFPSDFSIGSFAHNTSTHAHFLPFFRHSRFIAIHHYCSLSILLACLCAYVFVSQGCYCFYYHFCFSFKFLCMVLGLLISFVRCNYVSLFSACSLSHSFFFHLCLSFHCSLLHKLYTRIVIDNNQIGICFLAFLTHITYNLYKLGCRWIDFMFKLILNQYLAPIQSPNTN